MADNTYNPGPTLTALLMGQQRQQYDPAERSRKFAQALMQQGSSVEPVYSIGEGLARAGMGALGGFFAGQSDLAEKEQRQKTTSGLLGLANAQPGTPEYSAAMENLKDADPNIVAAIASQLIGQNANNQLLGRKFDAAAPTGPGAASGGPLSASINTTPLASPVDPNAAVSGATIPPGGFANNTGNIRAVPGVSFPGQGAPQNGFMTFDTPQSGVNAQRANLASYVNQNPNITVAQAMAKWAPPSENNTGQYISTIAENSGVNPGMPLAEVLKDPGMAAALLDAQARLEKGGVPPGATADTFMTAAGAAPPVPGSAPAVPGNQVAQAGGVPVTPAAPGAAPAAPGTVSNLPERSPKAAALEAQAQAAWKLNDRETAVKLREKANEEQATWSQDRTKMQADQIQKQQESDREFARNEAAKPLTDAQAIAGGYHDRMRNASTVLDSFEAGGKPPSAVSVIGKSIPIIGAATQSKELQSYNAAKLDWISAQLRKETGANMPAAEVGEIERRYFPQPGEGPEVIKQKAQARAVAENAMKREAGDKYKYVPPAAASAATPGASGGRPPLSSFQR